MKHAFSRFAETAAHFVGHPFALASALIAGALIYLLFGLEVTNFAISIVSLLLLFLLQASQNRDGIAIQAKLDEIIRSGAARDEFMGIDKLDEDEIARRRDAHD